MHLVAGFSLRGAVGKQTLPNNIPEIHQITAIMVGRHMGLHPTRVLDILTPDS